ncbi:hypothetical protein Tco_0946337 [Tanacetum coccineum]
MANKQNKMRDAIISRLRKEHEKEYQLINNLLEEINRYMLQNLDQAEEETRVTSLPLDEPLKAFTLQTLCLSSVSDKRIATILEAAKEKVETDYDSGQLQRWALLINKSDVLQSNENPYQVS